QWYNASTPVSGRRARGGVRVRRGVLLGASGHRENARGGPDAGRARVKAPAATRYRGGKDGRENGARIRGAPGALADPAHYPDHDLPVPRASGERGRSRAV